MSHSSAPSPSVSPATAAGWLARERRRIERALAELRSAGLDVQPADADIGEVAAASQHPADVASETLEREVDLGLIADFEAAARELGAAEQRLRDGHYGTCERCARAVPLERLELVPATRYCVACADVVERAATRPMVPDRRAVLVASEFLPADDEMFDDGDRDGRSAEEVAVHERPWRGSADATRSWDASALGSPPL